MHLLPRSASICQINSINFLKQPLLLFIGSSPAVLTCDILSSYSPESHYNQRAAGAAEPQEGCWPPSRGTGDIPTAFGLPSRYSWPPEQGKLPTGSSAPGGVCRDRRKAEENVLKMMKLGGLSGRRGCLENHFCALFWSRAKQKTCQ